MPMVAAGGRRRGNDLFAIVIKIGSTLGVINIGETALIERFGSVLGAVVDVLDLAFLRPAIPSSMTDVICAVVTIERSRRRVA